MVKCPECGHINPDTAEGCGNCGKDLPKVDKKASDVKSSTKKSSNTMIIAVIAIVVIIAIVGVFASGMFSSHDTSGSSSQSVAPTVDNNTTSSVNTQNSSSHNSASEYWASAKTDKFHLPTCEWAEKISDNNKVVYQSRNDAIADGKQPCSVCNP